MARTIITTDEQGYVSISYDSWITGDRVERTFFCPSSGGYVRERDSRGQYPQVCARLARTGTTLTCGHRSNLPDLIRCEYRAMRRSEKKETARF